MCQTAFNRCCENLVPGSLAPGFYLYLNKVAIMNEVAIMNKVAIMLSR
jgi:hypothetical protein